MIDVARYVVGWAVNAAVSVCTLQDGSTKIIEFG